MESQVRCSDTTNENIPSTLEKGSQGKAERKFKLVDLNRLTFQLDEQGPTFDVETCTPEQFNAWASEMADIEDVDINVWPLETRRDFINDLWAFCVTNSYEFPLTEIEDKPASEGNSHATAI